MRNIPNAAHHREDGYRSIVKLESANHTITEANIVQGGFVYDSRMIEGNGFEVGTAIADEITLLLDNQLGIYDRSYMNEEFTVSLSCVNISTGVQDEWYTLGKFIVKDVDMSNSDTCSMLLQDRMVLLDVVVDSFSVGTLYSNLATICSSCGVSISDPDGVMNTLYMFHVYSTVNNNEITARDFVRGCALLCGTNAYMTNTGELSFRKATNNRTSISFYPSDRYSSWLKEQERIGGVQVLDEDGTTLFVYDSGSATDYNVRVTITPSSSVIIDLIGGIGAIVDVYEEIADDPTSYIEAIPQSFNLRFNYYPLEMATIGHWEIEPFDEIPYKDKEGNTYYSIVTSVASVLNGRTSITSATNENQIDKSIPSQTDSVRTMSQSLQAAADDARKVATNYLNFTQQNGLDVGYADTLAKTRISGDGVEIFDANGVSMEYLGSQGNHPYARIGYESEGYMETSNGGLDLKFNGNEIAHMGWGETNADPFWGGTTPTETEMAPYYTFGNRDDTYEDNDNVEHDAYVGQNSFVTGKQGVAIGPWSYVGGYGNVATDQFQTVVGQWNDPDEPGLFVVGAGTHPAIGQRSNALVVGGQSTAVMIHGDAHVDGKLTADNMGYRVTDSGGTVITSRNMASSSSTTNIAQTPSLAPGIYIINIHVQWEANTSGRRVLTMSTSSGGSAISGLYLRRVAPVNGAATDANITAVVAPTTTSGRVYYINAGQNSGSTLAVEGIYQIYRIG